MSRVIFYILAMKDHHDHICSRSVFLKVDFHVNDTPQKYVEKAILGPVKGGPTSTIRLLKNQRNVNDSCRCRIVPFTYFNFLGFYEVERLIPAHCMKKGHSGLAA